MMAVDAGAGTAPRQAADRTTAPLAASNLNAVRRLRFRLGRNWSRSMICSPFATLLEARTDSERPCPPWRPTRLKCPDNSSHTPLLLAECGILERFPGVPLRAPCEGWPAAAGCVAGKYAAGDGRVAESLHQKHQHFAFAGAEIFAWCDGRLACWTSV